ncbi:MAG: hypothetical protein IT363_04335 [Methanoregulaceae archaeon]|nr:hypothetical protein [Methanoregulaceae archaeon]
MNWLKKLFARKKEPVPTHAVVQVPVSAAGTACDRAKPSLQEQPRATPHVAIMLSDEAERRAFQRGFEAAGLPAAIVQKLLDGTWPPLDLIGQPRLVVVDDRAEYERIRSAGVDGILVTDDSLDAGPVDDHWYLLPRPVNLADPLGVGERVTV